MSRRITWQKDSQPEPEAERGPGVQPGQAVGQEPQVAPASVAGRELPVAPGPQAGLVLRVAPGLEVQQAGQGLQAGLALAGQERQVP